jgi:hypothetical protein
MQLINRDIEFTWSAPSGIKLHFYVYAKLCLDGSVKSFDYEVSRLDDDDVCLSAAQIKAIDFLVETKLNEDWHYRSQLPNGIF